MDFTLETILKECPEWFHSIELSPTVTTPGRASSEAMSRELRLLRLPDLHGKSVLDIGAYDGYFSFAAERLGASRVVALDHYVWAADMAGYVKDWRESKQNGKLIPAPHESRHWRPNDLPGRKPFDLARKILGSKVEPVVGDFMTMDLAKLGRFDVVFFLGVLYHLENPLLAMRRAHRVMAPGGLVVVETEAMEAPGLSGRPMCEFFPGQELNNDASNWWSPNAMAVEGLCRAAGFREVSVFKNWSLSLKYGFPRKLVASLIRFSKDCSKGRFGLPVVRYRVVAHAADHAGNGL
jgi:tRNA (mo5U34)-methyltransferase